MIGVQRADINQVDVTGQQRVQIAIGLGGTIAFAKGLGLAIIARANSGDLRAGMQRQLVAELGRHAPGTHNAPTIDFHVTFSVNHYACAKGRHGAQTCKNLPL